MSSPSLGFQVLTSDALLLSAPRVEVNGQPAPALGGIPLLAKLGQGGMGAVYYGIHPRLDKEVAVKVLPLHLAQQYPDLIERFFREARIAARVESPHLLSVLDVNQEGGLFYLVMEFVHGLSAGAYLRRLKQSGAAGLDEAAALDICLGAAAGLAAAHAQGIIHRDIKPDNILVPWVKDLAPGEGERLNFAGAKVADLGLARGELIDKTLTRSDAALGTPGFMAPEQGVSASKAGKPADVFSLGATVYALLSGHAPFQGDSGMAIMLRTIQEPHPPIRGVCPGVSAGTAALVDCCLAKDPRERYVDGSALLAALQLCRSCLHQTAAAQQHGVEELTVLRNAPEVGRPVGAASPVPAPATPVAPPAAKARLTVALTLLALAVLGIGSYQGWRRWEALRATELARAADEALQAEQAARDKQAEEQRLAEEQTKARLAEAKRLAEDQAKADDAARQAEAKRLADEKAKADEAARAAAEQRQLELAQQALTAALAVALDAKKTGQWQQVVTALEEPLKGISEAAHPNRGAAQDLLAQARAELQAQRLREERYQAALKAGGEALAAAQWAEASTQFRKALEEKPDDATARQGVADAQAGEERARREAEAKASRERYEQALLEAGRKLKDSDFDGADAAFQRALRERPGDAAAQQGLAEVKAARDEAQYRAAMNSARLEVRELAQDKDGRYLGLTEAARKRAEAALAGALQVRPGDPAALALKAQLIPPPPAEKPLILPPLPPPAEPPAVATTPATPATKAEPPAPQFGPPEVIGTISIYADQPAQGIPLDKQGRLISLPDNLDPGQYQEALGASKSWLVLEQGTKVHVEAAGKWYSGPTGRWLGPSGVHEDGVNSLKKFRAFQGPNDGFGIAKLVVFVSDKKKLAIADFQELEKKGWYWGYGTEPLEFVMPAAGPLRFQQNRDGYYDLTQGAVRATITVQKPRK